MTNHITEKITETRWFFEAMKKADLQYAQVLQRDLTDGSGMFHPTRRPSDGTFASLAVVRFQFSAFISAFRSVWLYVDELRISDAEFKTWKDGTKSQPLFNALRLLRNQDIHAGTLQLATRHQIGNILPAPEGHVHLEFLTAGAALSLDGLLELHKFKTQPELAELLAAEPITTLAGRALALLEAQLAIPRVLGLLKDHTHR